MGEWRAREKKGHFSLKCPCMVVLLTFTYNQCNKLCHYSIRLQPVAICTTTFTRSMTFARSVVKYTSMGVLLAFPHFLEHNFIISVIYFSFYFSAILFVLTWILFICDSWLYVSCETTAKYTFSTFPIWFQNNTFDILSIRVISLIYGGGFRSSKNNGKRNKFEYNFLIMCTYFKTIRG